MKLLIGLIATVGYGATFQSFVSGTTNTQAIVKYVAPNEPTACTWEVSKSPTYSPVVNATNYSLFPGIDSDGGGTGLRAYVIGGRSAPVDSIMERQSIALQTATTFYYRITCGSDTSVGSFTTSNIPFGMTNGDPQPADGVGGWAYPTVDPTDRTQQVVDPQTGALISPVSISTDKFGSSFGLYIGDGGGSQHCNQTLQADPLNPGTEGYLCILWQENDARGTLYYLIPATGEVRNLGGVFWATPTINSNMDLYCTGASTGDCFGGSTAGVTYLRHYQGDFTPQSSADLTSPVVYNATSVGTLVNNFNATFDVSLFGCAGVTGGVGLYEAVDCKRGAQNSFGWEAIFYSGDGRIPVPSSCSIGDTGCPRIVAADYTFINTQTKYCGLHNTQLFHGQDFTPPVDTNMMLVNWHSLDGGSANDGTAFIGATTVGSVLAGSTTITVDGAIHSFASGGELAAIPTLAPGDVFQIQGIGQIFTLVSNISNVWTFTPATGDPIPAGRIAFMFCNVPVSTGDGVWAITGWDFLTYPNGSTVVYDLPFPGGGHYGLGPLGRTSETSGGEGFFPFNGGTLASSLNNPGVEIDSTAAYNGISPPGYGNLITKHPAYQNFTAAKRWFNDRMTFSGQPFDGSSLVYSDNPNGAINAISGTGGVLYQYVSAPSFPLSRKNTATQASTGGSSLIDISSPTTGNVLSPDAVDNYKYCVAYLANECRTGSSAGDVFFNVPAALSFLFCTGGDAPNPGNIDVCITNTPTYSGALMQWGMGTNSANTQAISRNVTYGISGVKDTFGFPVAKPTALGEYTLFTIGLGTNTTTNAMNTWKVLMPPDPAPDTINRTKYSFVDINVPTTGGVDNVIARFGYDSSFNCTSRTEECIATTSVSPFAFPSDGSSQTEGTVTGVSCSSGCTVHVPVISKRVVYVQLIKRNGGTIISSGPVDKYTVY